MTKRFLQACRDVFQCDGPLLISVPASKLYVLALQNTERPEQIREYIDEDFFRPSESGDLILEIRNQGKSSILAFLDYPSHNYTDGIHFFPPAIKQIRGFFETARLEILNHIQKIAQACADTHAVEQDAAFLACMCTWRALEDSFLDRPKATNDGRPQKRKIYYDVRESSRRQTSYFSQYNPEELPDWGVIPRFDWLKRAMGQGDDSVVSGASSRPGRGLDPYFGEPSTFAVLPPNGRRKFKVRVFSGFEYPAAKHEVLKVALGFPHDKKNSTVVRTETKPHRFSVSVEPEFRAALRARLDKILDAIETQGDCQIVMFPELSLDETCGERIEAFFSKTNAKQRVRLVVAGSVHGYEGKKLYNVATVYHASGHSVRHHKINPYWEERQDGQILREDIAHGKYVTIFLTRSCSFTVLICADVNEGQMIETLKDLGVNLVLVPAMTAKAGFFFDHMRELKRSNQAAAFSCNQLPPGVIADPDFRTSDGPISCMDCPGQSEEPAGDGDRITEDGGAVLPFDKEEEEVVKVYRCGKCRDAFHVIPLSARTDEENSPVVTSKIRRR